MSNDVYLVERVYFGLGESNKDKIVSKIYSIRKSKDKCTDRRSRKSAERIAHINLNNLNWINL